MLSFRSENDYYWSIYKNNSNFGKICKSGSYLEADFCYTYSCEEINKIVSFMLSISYVYGHIENVRFRRSVYGSFVVSTIIFNLGIINTACRFVVNADQPISIGNLKCIAEFMESLESKPFKFNWKKCGF